MNEQADNKDSIPSLVILPKKLKKRKIVQAADLRPISETTSPSGLASLHDVACSLAEKGAHAEAVSAFETVIRLTPQAKPNVHEMKAQCLLELGEVFAAIGACNKAIELDSAYAYSWLTLGRAQMNFGEPAMAVKSFESAIERLEQGDEIDEQSLGEAREDLANARTQLEINVPDGTRFKVLREVKPRELETEISKTFEWYTSASLK